MAYNHKRVDTETGWGVSLRTDVDHLVSLEFYRSDPKHDESFRLLPEQVDALSRLVRCIEDKKLGRWRWPENPLWVVYPHPNGTVTPVNEALTTHVMPTCRRGDRRKYDYECAAQAYFDAHPLPEPWHSAKADEVWALSVDDSVEMLFRVLSFKFVPIEQEVSQPTFARNSDRITAGRRIWPEVEKGVQ